MFSLWEIKEVFQSQCNSQLEHSKYQINTHIMGLRESLYTERKKGGKKSQIENLPFLEWERL